MKAFLLAAGLGTRLRPLTDHLPKCLVDIGGRPLLDIWLDTLASAGVDEVLLNVHHLSHLVEEHVVARAGRAPFVHVVHEPVLLGSAGTMRANRDFVAGERFFLAINADNLTTFDIGQLVQAHHRAPLLATLAVFHAPHPERCGIVTIEDGLVVGFEEKPTHPVGDLANAGLYAFDSRVLDLLEGDGPLDIGRHLLPLLVGLSRVVDIGDSFFVDIGTPETLAYARGSLAAGGSPMIITQTPLRIGLVGGGTDLPAYYREHGGRVLNAAIDKYVYVVVKQRFDDDIYLNYSRKEIVSRVADIEHDLVREAMHMAGVRGGVEITTLADIPSAGSGLGSSSSVTVGLLHALFAYQGVQVSAEELADRACTIELERCGKPIGKQDQYAAAYGGICDLRFGPGDRVGVDPIRLPAHLHRAFQAELMLFYTGITRSADTILKEQSDNVVSRLAQLDLLKMLAGEAADGLRRGEPAAVGLALGKSWEAKRQLASGVSNSSLDQSVDAVLAAGATGAKIAGAGGGGFVLVCCPVEHQAAVRQAVPGLKELPIKVDPHGSRVIFNVHRDIWA